jgi:DNA polymerase alpha subunit A
MRQSDRDQTTERLLRQEEDSIVYDEVWVEEYEKIVGGRLRKDDFVVDDGVAHESNSSSKLTRENSQEGSGDIWQTQGAAKTTTNSTFRTFDR